jgi:hypothetical protein
MRATEGYVGASREMLGLVKPLLPGAATTVIREQRKRKRFRKVRVFCVVRVRERSVLT